MLVELKPKDLTEKYKAKLAESGLLEHAKTLKFKLHPAAPPQIFPAAPGISIPYFDLQGRPVDFYRYRLLTDTRSQWDVVAGTKPRRYTQPAGSGVMAYLPPLDCDWVEMAGNPAEPVIITEGEFKAACATAHGYPAIGLGGVWSWKQDDAPLPIFQQFNWAERRVFVIYDSDAVTNVQVNKAERALCKALGEWGALPHIIRLPAAVSGAKQGLDDFIMGAGTTALDLLVAAAEPWGEVEPLHAMNEMVTVVLNPPCVAELHTGHIMNTRDMININYAPLRHWVQVGTNTQGEPRMKQVGTAAEWLKWPGRAVVHGMTFSPGQPRITQGKFNQWNGWGAVADATASIAPWTKLLDYAFAEAAKEHRVWFEQWAAYPIQHPGAKMNTAVVMFGVQEGTGKTLIGQSLMELYGEHGLQAGEAILHDERNAFLGNKQFLLSDEITGSEKYHVADKLKDMITQKHMMINQKYVPGYKQDNCINFFFTSNRVSSFIMGDKDRRYFIHEMEQEPLNQEFYDTYVDWLYTVGKGALMHHLLHVDLTGFEPGGKAPVTDAKKEMERLGRSEVADWCHNVLHNPWEYLREGQDITTVGELMLKFDPAGTSRVNNIWLARELRTAGAERANRGAPIPYLGKSTRFVVIRNMKKWRAAAAADIIENYTYGRQEKKY